MEKRLEEAIKENKRLFDICNAMNEKIVRLEKEQRTLIEVELRKFVSFMKSNDSFIEDQRYFDEWLEEYMGGKSDEIKEIKNERKT